VSFPNALPFVTLPEALVHLRRILSLVSLFVLSTAGMAAAQTRAAAPNGGSAPAAAVERLMRLAESRSYREMGSVFGTASGPVSQQWPIGEVEQRMYAIASILQNERFVIRGEQPVPGRLGTAVRLMVEIKQPNKRSPTQVPFTVVRSGDVWLVEQIELERLTRAD
jgi:hypothetical protein